MIRFSASQVFHSKKVQTLLRPKKMFKANPAPGGGGQNNLDFFGENSDGIWVHIFNPQMKESVEFCIFSAFFRYFFRPKKFAALLRQKNLLFVT